MCTVNHTAARMSLATIVLVFILIMLNGCALNPSVRGTTFPNLTFTLEDAKSTVHTLNSIFVPAHKTYTTYYDAASKEQQATLNKVVNPEINAATDALINLTSIVMAWELLHQTPANFDTVMLDTSAAVNSAVETIEHVIQE